jgi:hypothetical protein
VRGLLGRVAEWLRGSSTPHCQTGEHEGEERVGMPWMELPVKSPSNGTGVIEG